ncbi:MAG: iron-containing redox enzyme family protein [Thiolinea sp.]
MNAKVNTQIEETATYNAFMHEINRLSHLIDKYPFENPEAYGYYLNQQYFLIRYTTRLIALSASMVETGNTREFQWWAEHLQEEMDHDQLILTDMAEIGYQYSDDCEPILRGLSLALFEDIRRHGQDAILGYALMLEGLSMKRCGILAERVKAAYGTGYSYLNVHGIADEEHFPEGIQRLETLPQERKKIVLENLYMSSALYYSFLSKISKPVH